MSHKTKTSDNLDQWQGLKQAVNDLWPALTVSQTKDQDTLIGLPNDYIVPSLGLNRGFTYQEQYYWDSYFIVQALLLTGQDKLAKGMVDNLLFLLERYGFVPNANRFYMLSRSQPPTLHKMVRLLVENNQVNKTWIKKAYGLLKHEYASVWTCATHPHNRQVFQGLSRYYDINLIHSLAEAESGWDKTNRFMGKCLNYCPVDLNALLFDFENNMAWLAEELGQEKSMWLDRAKYRQENIVKYMWHHDNGWFYDYNYLEHCQSLVASLAGVYPLWVGINHGQDKLIANITNYFETSFGLQTTKLADNNQDTQWVSPNGWAPLHLIAFEALANAGQTEPATRIAVKWLNTVKLVYEQTGNIYEKYNVVAGSHLAKDGHYPMQTGFGWTNAVVITLLDHLGQLDG